MITRKTFLAASLSASTALALASCGSDDGANSDGSYDITFWHSASGTAAEVVDKAVADFNAAQEGKIEVSAVFQGSYDDAITKLANAVQAKNLPDLMQANDVNTQYMIDTQLTVSADELNSAAKNQIDFANYAPVVQRYYTIAGTMRSIPFQISQPVLYLNKKLVADAGLDIENPPTTFADLVTWAKTINEKTGKGGIVFHLTPWWFEELTASTGLEYCTPDKGAGKEAASAFVLTDPKQVAQWEGFQELYQSGAAVNVGTDGNNAQTSFSNGDAGILLASSAAYGNVSGSATFDIVLAPMPLDDPTSAVVPGGNSVWIIGKDPKGGREQAAYEFAKYLASDEVQSQSFVVSGYLPATITAAKAIEGDADANQKVLLEQLAREAASPAAAGCHSGALQPVRNEVQAAMEESLVGGADVKTTFQKVEEKAPALIEDYNKRAGK